MEFSSPIFTPILIGSGIAIALIVLYIFFKRRASEDKEAQKLLNEYLDSNLSPSEIGTFYERYIGHLYEEQGYHVKYNGAVNGFDDLGRDLIVMGGDEVLIIQAKCWARHKRINEKHIFQLYGSMAHFEKTYKGKIKTVRAVFYTTAH